MSNKTKLTTINVSPETKERISKYGGFKDTYDTILNKMADIVDEYQLASIRSAIE